MDTCCSVCCENFNKTTRKKVTCPFCDYESCKKCTQTYLLSSTENAHCMNCKHELNRSFIDSFCTKRFRNVEYKKHRENVLFDLELIKMPETQPQVERILRMREIRKEYHASQRTLRTVILDKRDAEISNYPVDTYIELELELNIKLNNLVYEMNMLRSEYDDPPTDSSERKFIRICPSEDCRGFIDDDWKCGLCKQQFCKHCNEKKDENHVCDPKTVETISLINKDTKPCPNCGTMIHKIDGCAQMWCTSCNTAFNWKNGKIETGRIHNPHFFEFQKRSREHADIPCGGRPTFSELNDQNAPDELLDITILLHKIDRDIMHRYGDIYDADNHHLRIAYMLKNITEQDFKIELQKRDKLADKTQDIRDILEMFTNSVGDFLRQWMIYKNLDILEDVYELTLYSNRVIHDIRKRYNSSTPSFIYLPRTLVRVDI